MPPSVVPVEPRLPKGPPPIAGFAPKKPPPGALPLGVPVIGPPPKSGGGALGAPVFVPVPPPNNPPPVEVVLPPPPSPAANEPKVDPDDPCVPVFGWGFCPVFGKLKPENDIFVGLFKLLQRFLDPPPTAMTAPLARYESFLIGNASTIATIESSLRSVTWILPGRFKDAELASEACM